MGADIAQLVSQALQAVVKRLASEADGLNRLDAVSGDGDTGSAFKRAGEAIARDLANGKLVLNRPSSLFRRLGLIAESRMGGTSGASNEPKETLDEHRLRSFSLWTVLRGCRETLVLVEPRGNAHRKFKQGVRGRYSIRGILRSRPTGR